MQFGSRLTPVFRIYNNYISVWKSFFKCFRWTSCWSSHCTTASHEEQQHTSTGIQSLTFWWIIYLCKSNWLMWTYPPWAYTMLSFAEESNLLNFFSIYWESTGRFESTGVLDLAETLGHILAKWCFSLPSLFSSLSLSPSFLSFHFSK